MDIMEKIDYVMIGSHHSYIDAYIFICNIYCIVIQKNSNTVKLHDENSQILIAIHTLTHMPISLHIWPLSDWVP